ncbi:hypothetical protein FDP41_012787 [Naegleria fowleri]|uniref:Uncharacterized protein n=1 Tax=Naegleria fowleri TaxID=5763 RepID=A0A6A5C6S7_NAEFO|nr:uncharacterized protein FDP41_012787 [Naegleria fowleri]KAF0980999.1 hypothetical protein FDP41_012787 [Naegleria fowleri]
MQNVTKLDLNSNSINEEGAAISSSSYMDQLREFNLGRNPMGNAGISAIATSQYKSHLKALSTSETLKILKQLHLGHDNIDNRNPEQVPLQH